MLYNAIQSSVRQAYVKWKEQAPHHSKGSCCYRMHFNPNWVPLADHEVCKREAAWRKYVRVRDSNPGWPFILRPGIV